MNKRGLLVIMAALFLPATPLAAQPPIRPTTQAPAIFQPMLPPATKLEAFAPAEGAVLTIGYDRIGRVGSVAVDATEMRDAKGGVRGIVVEIRGSQDSRQQSFVDADEIPDLLKAVDTLLGTRANPTPFKMFEVRYSTRGELQLAAFSDLKGAVSYSVQVGRIERAQSVLDLGEMFTLRGFFDAAWLKLNSTPK